MGTGELCCFAQPHVKSLLPFPLAFHELMTQTPVMALIEVEAPPEIEWDLVDRLHKSLRLAGLKPGQMADHLDVHRNTVGGWLRGRQMTKATLLAWAAKCSETSPISITFEWLTVNMAQTCFDGLSSPSDQHVLLDQELQPVFDFTLPANVLPLRRAS